MSFQLTCPNCGKRPVAEFAFNGEYKHRPKQDEGFKTWAEYVYMKGNKKGIQVEWWNHRAGCRRWFLVKRDTTNNLDHQSVWFENKDQILT